VFTQKGKLPEIDQGCRMAGIGCIDCKKILNESLKGVLDPIREEREKLIGQKDKINAIMETGSQSASKEADKTLELVKEAMKI
ncbi:MAG: tryptophan--tRNA ligase, partial [Nitrospirae bacterium]|nr:tryptophan--tRNA ligase [Nitrospirota bacterium]